MALTADDAPHRSLELDETLTPEPYLDIPGIDSAEPAADELDDEAGLDDDVRGVDLRELLLSRVLLQAQLREQEDQRRVVRAEREQHYIDEAGGPKGLGSNTEDRERALIIKLADDEAYQAVVSEVQDLTVSLGFVEAELEFRRIERRETEIADRQTLIQFLAAQFAADRTY